MPYEIIEPPEFITQVLSVLEDEVLWMKLREHLDLALATRPDLFKDSAGVHAAPMLTLQFDVDHDARCITYRELVCA